MSDTNEPDAYGLLDQGEVHYATPFRDEAERVLRRTEDKDSVIVPLYRQPTLTDAERDDLRVWRDECLRQASTATEGANEELAERWQGRAKRAAAMIERLGGGE